MADPAQTKNVDKGPEAMAGVEGDLFLLKGAGDQQNDEAKNDGNQHFGVDGPAGPVENHVDEKERGIRPEFDARQFKAAVEVRQLLAQREGGDGADGIA